MREANSRHSGTYGKESDIEKCFVKEILDLPNISGTDPHKIKEFCETLTHSVQALETMVKLDNVKGNVSMTLDKLSGIRGDLVRGDPDWETCDFVKLTEAVKQWVRRNPATDFPGDREETKHKRVFNTKNEKYRPRGCVYCGDLNHKAVQCEKVTDISERKRILARKGLCFNCAAKQHRIDKSELLSITNPQYGNLIKRYQHLNSVNMVDTDTNNQLPIHVILGSGDYARIKTPTKSLIGRDGEPVAERTKFGCTILSPGVEFDHKKMMLTQTSQVDFDQLCRLDVLGLADSAENDQILVYTEFQEQLERNPKGWYETGLPWKPNHPPPPTNKTGSRQRLENLVKRLNTNDHYHDYNAIIQQQLGEGVIEAAPVEATGTEFYIPHKAVVKSSAESTKLRIVYDASAKESRTSPSLNDCLNPGPSLQNHLWAILVRSRFHPILLTGDLEKAFLQVRIKELERDALRFHWRGPGNDETLVYRFTRALFGLRCSPFLLNGVLGEHLKSWETKYPSLVDEIRKGLYVDDLMTGGSESRRGK